MDQEAADEVIALEKRLHDSDVRRSRDHVDQLLADSFVEIASSGRLYTQSEIIDDLANEEPGRIDASGFVRHSSACSFAASRSPDRLSQRIRQGCRI